MPSSCWAPEAFSLDPLDSELLELPKAPPSLLAFQITGRLALSEFVSIRGAWNSGLPLDPEDILDAALFQHTKMVKC